MKFTPLSNEEIETANLLVPGIYDYLVTKAEDKISKAGNEYTSIILKVWDAEGREHSVFTNMALIKLLKHFCDVNKLDAKYLSGDLPPELFMGRSCGKVVIDIEPEKFDVKANKTYRAKNIVTDYIVDPPGSLMKPLPDKKNDLIDDELPF